MAEKRRTSRVKQVRERRARRRNNFTAILLIVVALFVALSVYFCVEQLTWLADIGKGLLGVSIYLLPIALIYIAISVILPEMRVSTGFKIAASVAILMVVGMAFYLFCDPMYTQKLDVGLLWQGSKALKAGGVVEGIIAVPLILVISRPGLGIILAAVTLFSVLTVTDRTLYDLWQGIKKIFLSMKPPEKAEPEVVDMPDPVPENTVQGLQKSAADIDVPIETYEVASDGLDEHGESVAPTPTAGEPPEETGAALEISGLNVFTYQDVDPENNIRPEEIGIAENPKDTAAQEMPDIDVSQQEPVHYVFPTLDLLQKPQFSVGTSKDEVDSNAKKLLETLHDFGVEAKMLGASVGPNITRYELQPRAGTKVSKITGLSDDIALSLAATQVRIEAPIPGKAAVGIEIPNQSACTVYIRDLLDCPDFTSAKSPLTVALGKDISGKNIYADLSKMPHLLIAGSTGSGKSVCINTILISLLYKSSPEDVKLILVDPKVVELGVYNRVPHLFIPVVTDPKKAAGALHWACSEMDRRYNLFQELSVREITSYNEMAARKNDENYPKLPRIVVVIDELADLMMVASKEVEEHICRLCQKARAAGIFLIIATQRPSVDVVTGLIKANVPSRIAFAVSSGTDSRVILDTVGAEKLLGRGDMLYKPIGANKPRRIQGCFVDDREVENVVDFIREHAGEVQYDDAAIQKIDEISVAGGKGAPSAGGDEEEDEMLMPAIECVVEAGMASTSSLQRRLKLGYSRAARLIDIMEEMGIVGPFEGSKPRQVKMSAAELQEFKLQRGAAKE